MMSPVRPGLRWATKELIRPGHSLQSPSLAIIYGALSEQRTPRRLRSWAGENESLRSNLLAQSHEVLRGTVAATEKARDLIKLYGTPRTS